MNYDTWKSTEPETFEDFEPACPDWCGIDEICPECKAHDEGRE